MDDKKLWRVSKKDSIFETTHFSSKPDVFRRSFSTKTSSSSSKPILTRSFTTKPSSYPSSSGSMKCQADTSSTKCSISRSLSHKGASVTRKCRDVAKEHKSRFYIIKRCVLMLVCWHKHA
ncbi:hypothetical protein F2Q70_00005520 [Brassica cretica]|uniref:Uncharacterized protein n=1 Tax=Brassica cretica TaxID=69181 RepID=A0A8S9J3D4_BRACR|nr:hypothetical protein F2Q70_00005520 [Brassica cretica]KAF3566616.1 hypothetical protein DY000_02017947 [Brassica cretica]